MKKLLILIGALLGILIVRGASPEARRAFRIFEQRAEQGDSEARYRLATILETGWDSVPHDSVRALSLIRSSAAAGFPPAMNYLGYLYDRGYTVNGRSLIAVNRDSSIYWLKNAADLNDPRAMSNLAYILLNADTVGKNSDEIGKDRSMAVMYLTRAADAEAPTAMSMLGDLYRDGRGVPRDTAKAAELYEKALSGGLGDAEPRLITLMIRRWDRMPQAEQLRLGERYLTTYAPAAGVLLLERAADDTRIPCDTPQMARALYWLGEAASRGVGMPVNPRLGMRRYIRAARLGDADAIRVVDDFRGLYPDDYKALCDSL